MHTLAAGMSRNLSHFRCKTSSMVFSRSLALNSSLAGASSLATKSGDGEVSYCCCTGFFAGAVASVVDVQQQKRVEQRLSNYSFKIRFASLGPERNIRIGASVVLRECVFVNGWVSQAKMACLPC